MFLKGIKGKKLGIVELGYIVINFLRSY